jgi:uncharacterized protein DUF3105
MSPRERATAFRILASAAPTPDSAGRPSLGYPVAPMAKRRTSGIQRRSRASETAMSRRIGPSGSGSALDPRILLIGGVLVIGAIVLVVVLLFSSSSGGQVGTRQPDQGTAHVPQTEVPTYDSRPATSGPHWNLGNGIAPLNWGVYTEPVAEPAAVHNLEHGGIVIWYQANQLDPADLQALADFVNQQIQTAKFKVILSPWSGEDFGHPIAATAWDWLLYQDNLDINQIRAFINAHYQESPEPQGGPPQPGT